MSRPREFDAEAALDRALDVLWTRGYEATSVDDLCAATGLSRSSLYAAYGGKRDLLLKAVDRYVELRTPVIAATLAGPFLSAPPSPRSCRKLSNRSYLELDGAAASSAIAPPNCREVTAVRWRGYAPASSGPKRPLAMPSPARGRVANCRLRPTLRRWRVFSPPAFRAYV